jgi:regulator of sirC expression with transglutaminase-like and TPR domain
MRFAVVLETFVVSLCEAALGAPVEQSPEFRRLIEGDPSADLTLISLEIAHDHDPDLDPARYLRIIDRLAERVRDRCPSGAKIRHLLGQINWVLFIEEQYRGNTGDYRDPRNSLLSKVIDRKLGIPISLSVLYRAIAHRLGLELSGVNLPYHFMLRAGQGADSIYVDSFHQGTLLDRQGVINHIDSIAGSEIAWNDEQFAPCDLKTIVARSLNNLRGIYLQQGGFEPARLVLRRLIALLPDDPEIRRDHGMVCMAIDRPGEAILSLQTYLAHSPQSDDSETVRNLLRVARSDLAARN